jgi:hypothetical protein
MLRPMWNLSLMMLSALSLTACPGGGGTTTDDAETGAETTVEDPTTSTSMPTTSTMDPSGTTEEGTTTTTGEPDTSESTADETSSSSTTGPIGETAANGEACAANGDCMSIACEKFRDLEDGVCVEGPGGGNTRVVGTLVDFISLEPIASTELRALEALTALMNPTEGAAILTAMSDADGKVDATSMMPWKAAFGVVGIVQGGDYYPTATGLAAPLMGQVYGPMNGNHDIWAVPSAKLNEWSTMLTADAALAEFLPLGEKGGVVGFVRDRTTGMGYEGAVVAGLEAPTGAQIRYLSEDGTNFDGAATSSSGLFVLMDPGLAEQFTVEGKDTSGSAGSSEGAIFVLILSVDP